MIQRGGLITTYPINNSDGTCMIDSAIQSIMNSNKLAIYLFQWKDTDEIIKYIQQQIENNIFDLHPLFNFIDLNKSVYTSLLNLYVRTFYSMNYNQLLDIINEHILFAHNNHDIPLTNENYEYYYNNVVIRGKETGAYPRIIKDLINDNGDIIQEIINGDEIKNNIARYAELATNTPEQMMKNTFDIINNLHTNTSDIWIYYQEPFTDILKITKDDMKKINMIYKISTTTFNNYICTDMILSANEFVKYLPYHSVYYNILENNMQNADRIYHLPISYLTFNDNISNIFEYIQNLVKHNGIINKAFFGQGTLCVYTPLILHFQKVNVEPVYIDNAGYNHFEEFYSEKYIINRLKLIGRINLPYLNSALSMKIKPMLDNLCDSINHYQNKIESDIEKNPYNLLEKVVHMPIKLRVHTEAIITNSVSYFLSNGEEGTTFKNEIISRL